LAILRCPKQSNAVQQGRLCTLLDHLIPNKHT